MIFVDTHAHLYSEEYNDDRAAMMQRAIDAGVQQFYLPAIDSTAIKSMLQLEQDYAGQCHAMMGLHPCYVKENYEQELAIVANWLSKRSFAAVGEIGLDFYWDTNFKTQQYAAFEQQIEMAITYKLPIVIHTRNAMQETINIVKSYASKGLRGIFHCFGGSIESANEIIKAGFSLGIGGVVTYKKAGLAEVLKQVPLQYVVLETDAPYLSPTPYRGKRNESAYLTQIANKLTEIYEMPIEEIAAITTANATAIFAKKLDN
jgi:TatD DNase family protein